MTDNKKFEGPPVGRNMPGALKGDQNDRGGISPNYQGRCKNAVPGYKGTDKVEVNDFAQGKMQAGRQKNKE